MKLQIRKGLPFVRATLSYQGRRLTLAKVLVDTGSVGTIFPADKVSTIGLVLGPHDLIRRIRGVGGAEFVFTKQVDILALGELQVDGFEIEIGAMAYGFDIEGIIGMDFLTQSGAVIDLAQMQIYRSG